MTDRGALPTATCTPHVRTDTSAPQPVCRRALQVGDPTYRTVKGILAAGTEGEGLPEAPVTVDAPAHLHGPSALFDDLGEREAAG